MKSTSLNEMEKMRHPKTHHSVPIKKYKSVPTLFTWWQCRRYVRQRGSNKWQCEHSIKKWNTLHLIKTDTHCELRWRRKYITLLSPSQSYTPRNNSLHHGAIKLNVLEYAASLHSYLNLSYGRSIVSSKRVLVLPLSIYSMPSFPTVIQ